MILIARFKFVKQFRLYVLKLENNFNYTYIQIGGTIPTTQVYVHVSNSKNKFSPYVLNLKKKQGFDCSKFVEQFYTETTR